MSELSSILATVDARLRAAEAACGSFADDPENFHARHRAAMAGLAEQLAADVGARITERWDGARVRIGGISSSSTSGLGGALRNWIVAARRRASEAS